MAAAAPRKPRRKTPPEDLQLDPWERRDAETDQAWAAFVAFRDMGLERSLGKVAVQLSKSKPLMQRWSIRHSWVMRTRSWDREVDKLWRLQLRVAQRKSAERMMNTAAAAMQVAGAGLSQIATKPGDLKAQDIARLMEVSAKLEQIVYGTPDHLVVTTQQGPASRDHVQQMSAEDVRTRMIQLHREVGSRLGEGETA